MERMYDYNKQRESGSSGMAGVDLVVTRKNREREIQLQMRPVNWKKEGCRASKANYRTYSALRCMAPYK